VTCIDTQVLAPYWPIDRHFFRSKYDAAKTLEAFSAKLRDETDLDALNAELVGVVKELSNPPMSRCGCVLPPRPRGAKGVAQEKLSVRTCASACEAWRIIPGLLSQ
jgi:hypothetical protein